ncbi:gp48.01 [Caviid betaherpesvirus 2]|uniref:Gp48.01 n=1 Tax=Guinea pig cytomegalovirus (strain 22122) TaxID=103920 RepID=L7Z493_GPCMV|nr:gp48.01 [Caviid betaherpesvirus 2]AGE11526.1 gp48.01 [Caviid betaherpesvirus 2]AIL83914.1 gp48.01 [BAC cloning vector GPN13BACdenovo_preserved(MM)]
MYVYSRLRVLSYPKKLNPYHCDCCMTGLFLVTESILSRSNLYPSKSSGRIFLAYLGITAAMVGWFRYSVTSNIFATAACLFSSSFSRSFLLACVLIVRLLDTFPSLRVSAIGVPHDLAPYADPVTSLLSVQTGLTIVVLTELTREVAPVRDQPQQPICSDLAQHHGGEARPGRTRDNDINTDVVIVHGTRRVRTGHGPPQHIGDPESTYVISQHRVDRFFAQILAAAKRAVREIVMRAKYDALFLLIPIIQHRVQRKRISAIQPLFTQV